MMLNDNRGVFRYNMINSNYTRIQQDLMGLINGIEPRKESNI